MSKILIIGYSPFADNKPLFEDKRYSVFKQVLPYVETSKGALTEDMFETTYLLPSTTSKPSELKIPNIANYAAVLTVDSKSTAIFIQGQYNSLLESKGEYQGTPIYPVKVPFTLSDATIFAYRLADIVAEILDNKVTKKPDGTNIIMISSVFQWFDALSECIKSGVVSFDVETNQVDDKNKEVFYYQQGFKVKTLAITPYAGTSYVLPVEHEESPLDIETMKVCMQGFIRLLENPSITKVAHNMRYDLNAILKYYEHKPIYRGRFADTMLMAHLYNENERVSLENCVNMYLPTFSGYKISNYNIALEPLSKYNGEDTDMTIRLFYFFEVALRKDEAVYLIHRNLQMTVFWQLLFAERRGALIDKEFLEDSIRDGKALVESKKQSLLKHPTVIDYIKHKTEVLKAQRKEEIIFKINTSKMAKQWEAKLEALESDGISYELNFNSVPQLQDFLYLSPYGLKLKAYDENNEITLSTDKDALASLDHEVIDILKEYRGLEKVIKTFFIGIYNKLDSNGVLHGTFNIHGTRTGRLSSSEPNLQNLLTRTQLKDEHVAEMMMRVKKFFIAPKGYKVLQADFSQLELRLIAMFSSDKNMIEAYSKSMDLHCLTGSQINNVNYEDFMMWKDTSPSNYKLQRFCGKGANFSLSYGCSPDTYRVYVKGMTGVVIDKDTAKIHHANFFNNYPSMLTWHRTYIEKARKFGHVRTFFGRKRHLPDIHSKSPEHRAAAERQAINAPVQGTGGELALFLISIANKFLGNRAIMFNTVHDSFIYYVKEEDIDYVANVLKFITHNLPEFFKYFFKVDLTRWTVPLEIDIEVGDTWGAVKG